MSSYQKSLPHRPLQMSSRVWNELIDQAQGMDFQGSGGPFTPGAGVALRNDSGDHVDKYGILGLDKPYILATENEQAFHEQIRFSGVTPIAGIHEGRFAVATGPIANGQIGRGYISGHCLVRMTINPEAPLPCAEIADDDTAALANVAAGSAAVLWHEDNGEGEQWAVIRFGGGASNVSQIDFIKLASAGAGWDTTSAQTKTIANLTSFTFTDVDAGLSIVVGDYIKVIFDASNYMYGTVTAYSGTTLTFTSTSIVGSGAHSAWTIEVWIVQGFYAARVYDSELVAGARIWVADANNVAPNYDEFYLARIGNSTMGRVVYRTACVTAIKAVTCGPPLSVTDGTL